MMRSIGRGLFVAWAKSGKAPGYLYRAMERWGPQLAGTDPLTAILPNGCRVECDLRDHVQRQIYFQGVYEPIEAYLFTQLIRPGAVVVDAGANVGQYSLLASSAVGPTGTVHGFEPVPHTFDRFSRHLAANAVGNVVANRIALWHESAELQFGLPLSDEVNSGMYSVGAARESVAVRAIRFDDYAIEHRLLTVDVVKMDIEGAEWSALRGMAATLEQHRPILLMEVNRIACQRVGYDPEVFWGLLCGGFGYTAWRFGLSAGDWVKLPGADGLEQANVLFTQGELPAAVATGWDLKSCLRWARSGWSKG